MLSHESSEKQVGWKLKCPFCGEEVAKPDKVWSLKGDLTIGLFRCPNCGRAFRRKITAKRRGLFAWLSRLSLKRRKG